MEDKIREAFHTVQMDHHTGQRILNAIGEKNRTQNRFSLRRFAVAACLIAFVAVLCNPTVVEALENTVEKIITLHKNNQDIKTLEYKTSDGKFHDTYEFDEDGNMISSKGGNNLMVQPAWLVYQGDRVFFEANGERIDITDRFSMEEPFTYIYTDANKIIHYICIGGVFDPDPEKNNVGYAEWFYDPAKAGSKGTIMGWIGGYADNYWNKETDDDWPWLMKGKEALGIPWR